jgi:hypothetical protein
VLFVQDTTELDVTRPEQQVVGAGPMVRQPPEPDRYARAANDLAGTATNARPRLGLGYLRSRSRNEAVT